MLCKMRAKVGSPAPPYKKPDRLTQVCSPCTGEQRQADPWPSLLASQFILSAVRNLVSKTKQKGTEEDTQRLPASGLHMPCACTHTSTEIHYTHNNMKKSGGQKLDSFRLSYKPSRVSCLDVYYVRHNKSRTTCVKQGQGKPWAAGLIIMRVTRADDKTEGQSSKLS